MAANRSIDPDQDIARLTAERDALQVRLEKAIDVRNNLAGWNDDAKAKIAALTAKLARVREELPDDKVLQRIRGTGIGRKASGRQAADMRRSSRPEGTDAAMELCRIIKRIRTLLIRG